MFAAAGDRGAGVHREAGLVEDCLIASCCLKKERAGRQARPFTIRLLGVFAYSSTTSMPRMRQRSRMAARLSPKVMM